jgi:hypothetical protein
VSSPTYEPNGLGQRINRAVVLGPVLVAQVLADVARSVRDRRATSHTSPRLVGRRSRRPGCAAARAGVPGGPAGRAREEETSMITGPTDWSASVDFVDDPDAGERPLVVESPVAAERRGGKSLRGQAELDQRQRGTAR